MGLESGKILFEEVYESVGGGVVGVDLCGVVELRFDVLCELFAQFDSGEDERKERKYKYKRIRDFSCSYETRKKHLKNDLTPTGQNY